MGFNLSPTKNHVNILKHAFKVNEIEIWDDYPDEDDEDYHHFKVCLGSTVYNIQVSPRFNSFVYEITHGYRFEVIEKFHELFNYIKNTRQSQ